jgi:putative two-component system response regulator
MSQRSTISALASMRILIADEDPAALERLGQVLDDGGYGEVVSTPLASCGTACAVSSPDLVVIGLPAATRRQQANSPTAEELGLAPAGVPVLVVAGRSSPRARQAAVRLGADDVLTRPLDPELLLLRVRNLLELRHLRQTLAQQSDAVDRAVHERTLKVEQARLETLTILASVAEFHDDDTRQHAQRVGACTALIAQALGLPELLVTRIRDAAALHDIGKIGVSRRVLLKPGALTIAERENMMRHVEIGARLLAGARSPVLRLAAEIARTHHERWDGKGYLGRLRGEEIPLSGRITAVADVFDALIHNRPYRPAWDPLAAREEIARQAGRQFDPRVAAAFAELDHEALLAQEAEEDTASASSPAGFEASELRPPRPASPLAQLRRPPPPSNRSPPYPTAARYSP